MSIKNIFFASFAVLFLLGCSDSSTNNQNIKPKIKTFKPKKSDIKYPINLHVANQKNINITPTDKGFAFSHVKNKAVLVAFLTSWCPPCKAEIPHLNTLQKKHKKDLEIVGFLLENKNEEQTKEFIKKYNISFPLAYGENNFKFSKALGDIQTIPFMILYDKEGNYATHYTGAVPDEMIDIDIKKVVK